MGVGEELGTFGKRKRGPFFLPPVIPVLSLSLSLSSDLAREDATITCLGDDLARICHLGEVVFVLLLLTAELPASGALGRLPHFSVEGKDACGLVFAAPLFVSHLRQPTTYIHT